MSAVCRLSPQQRKSERKSNPTLSANNCREQAQQNCGYSITSSARATRELRARLKAVLGPEWLKQISKMTFFEGESFALPGDVVEDVRRKFGTKRGQHRRS